VFGIALELAAATDIGNVRRNNEDSFGYDTDQAGAYSEVDR
jgi:serine/threonine protein phosphatase PrpC